MRMAGVSKLLTYSDNYAKFWLEPVALAKSVGYSAREISEIKKLFYKM